MADYIESKTLENGNVLLYLKHNFLKDENKDNLFSVLSCLRDSQVIVPMNAIISKEDEEILLNAKVGDFASTVNEIRLKPDIFQKGDQYFFPIFLNIEQLPKEYRSHFSIMNMSILQCIDMAKTYDKVCGLVLDAFKEPMVIEFALADFIPKFKSRLDPEETV